MLRFLLVAIVSASLVRCEQLTDPEVETEQGIVKGVFRKSWKGRRFSAFYGIPYALPPVGELRFKPPEPASRWSGVYNATIPNRVECPQINFLMKQFNYTGVEDCLYLNVYVPEVPKEIQPLPVLFYIHGGGFIIGTGNPEYFGPDLLMDRDVVLITFNYRLGALGFLSTGNEVVPGNNGLKDQVLALKWTKQNIHHFGGNPNKVTIFGESAGAASAHLHVLSPLSRDLINGAIAQSGTALSRWAIGPNQKARTVTINLAKLLNCPTASDEGMIQCLTKIHPSEIVKQSAKFKDIVDRTKIVFAPVVEPNVEGAFLVNDPETIIKSGNVAAVPLVFGVTTEDGAIISQFVFNSPDALKQFNEELDKWLQATLWLDDFSNEDRANIISNVKKFYFNDKPIKETSLAGVTDLYTDSMFRHPQNVAVGLHTTYAKNPVFTYVFAYKSNFTFYGDPSLDYGVFHGDELLYLFSNTHVPNLSPNENMVDIMTTLWTNIATSGNPSEKSNLVRLPNWPPSHNGSLSYYVIKNENDIDFEQDLYKDCEEFWTKQNFDNINFL